MAPARTPAMLLHAGGGRATAGGARFEVPEVDSRPVEVDSRWSSIRHELQGRGGGPAWHLCDERLAARGVGSPGELEAGDGEGHERQVSDGKVVVPS